MVPGVPKLDRIDIRILSHLQKNGRATNVELAEAVGLSASPCLARVKRLEKAGYITGYSAQVQLQKLGSTVIIYTQITLADHRSQDFSRFESRVRQMSEVMECYLVSGGYDYLIKFVTFSIQHYQETMEQMLALGIGVEKYFSYVVMKPVFVKQNHDLEGFLNRDD